MLPSTPSAIFFDLDDTLLDQERSQRIGALRLREEHGLKHFPEDAFLQRWNTLLHEHIAPYFAGEISFQEHRRRRIRGIFENSALPDAEADTIFATYSRTYEGSWSLFDDALSCLDSLRGIRLGIISNGDPGQQRRKLKMTGIDQRFEAVVLSGEFGIAKPDPRIFLEACRQLKIDPTACLMVGDNWKWDILGARSAGLPGLWLSRAGGLTHDQPGIASLHELTAQWPR